MKIALPDEGEISVLNQLSFLKPRFLTPSSWQSLHHVYVHWSRPAYGTHEHFTTIRIRNPKVIWEELRRHPSW